MNTVILVGLRTGVLPERDRNWQVTRARWERLGWPINEGHHDPHEGPYCMAVAMNRAAALERWDVALCIGADFMLEDNQQAADAATRAVQTGQLVFAHNHLTLLNAEGAHAVADGAPPATQVAGLVRHSNTFSGALAVTRELWDAVGGFDERFVGWGWEDLAFWAACSAVAGGFGRIPGDMYHLWHPFSRAENEEHPLYGPNEVLGRRYLEAKGNPSAMRAILAER